MTDVFDPHAIAAGRIPMRAILRDRRPKAKTPKVSDGYANIYAATDFPGGPMLQFGSGINWNAAVDALDGSRLPAIVISSSPHKVGRAETPWQDTFEPDRGWVRYFGDNRTPGTDPARSLGNRMLLEQLELHCSPHVDSRRKAVPLVLFRRKTVDGRQKGFPQFHGFGILRRAELVIQLDRAGNSFSNYVFEILVFTLAPEHEIFDWKWINLRRDPDLSTAETLRAAPRAWRTWIAQGDESLPRVRRDVQRPRIRGTQDQLPDPGSHGERILRELRGRYKRREALFEPIAAWVAARRIGGEGIYRHHGVTRASGDRGFDFVGTIDIGSGFGSVRLVVLGQAKCETPTSATNAVHVARTVARLRRGWVGVYVTTSYFSRPTQEEILEDKYPLFLISGRVVAEELAAFLHERRLELHDALDEIEAEYGGLTEITDPEQLVFSGWPVEADGSLR